MSTSLKLGLLACCCAAGATGVCLISFEGSEIPWRSLSEDQGYSGTYKGKWSEKYSKYLLGIEVIKDEGNSKIDNTPLWEAKFKKFFSRGKKPKNGKFSSVNQANGDEATSLNKVCDEAYKSDSTDVKTSSEATDHTKFQEEEIWKFCSPSESKIKTVKEVSTETQNTTIYQGKVGGDYEDNLVSTYKNDWFWNLKQKELKEYNSWDSDSLSDNVFLKTQKNLNNESEEGYVDLRNACQSVYGKNKTEIEKYKKYVFQFCSLTGEENTNRSK